MPQARSLHVGLDEVDPDHYGGWVGELNACEADALSMRALAEGLGYSHESLHTRVAVREAVLASIRQAASALGAGDIFMLTYAGHGGQLPDRNGDEDDMIDETWCLYDGQLSDDELYRELSAFEEGVRVLVVSDSCHSGTVTRASVNADGKVELVEAEPELPARAMPRSVASATYAAHRTFYDELQRGIDRAVAAKVRAAVRLLSGCQDNQTSADGTFNGLFTGTLLAVWDGGRYPHPYRRFMRDIRMRMPSNQQPNHFLLGPRDMAFDEQTPFSVGALS